MFRKIVHIVSCLGALVIYVVSAQPLSAKVEIRPLIVSQGCLFQITSRQELERCVPWPTGLKRFEICVVGVNAVEDQCLLGEFEVRSGYDRVAMVIDWRCSVRRHPYHLRYYPRSNAPGPLTLEFEDKDDSQDACERLVRSFADLDNVVECPDRILSDPDCCRCTLYFELGSGKYFRAIGSGSDFHFLVTVMRQFLSQKEASSLGMEGN